MTMGLVIECCLFGLFTMCMGCEQSQTILTNQTTIDRLKSRRMDGSTRLKEVRPLSYNMKEIFGGNGTFNLHWLLPTRPEFRDWEDMVGFVVQDDLEVKRNILTVV